jgi:peptidoglycan/LPS O-acetylase OafA/YrhL
MSRLAPGMRVVGLFAVLALIAALEYGAGVAAGWGHLAYLLPLAIDTFVLGVLLAEQSRLADRLFALGLVEFTVVVSAVAGGHEGNVLLGGVLATALVLTLWRQDETIRRERRSREVPVAAREVQWQAQLTRTEPPAPAVNVPACEHSLWTREA